MNSTRTAYWIAVLLTALAVFGVPAEVALADAAPHIAIDKNTDTCAMCHRAHTAASETSRTSFGSIDVTGSALILGAWNDGGDTGLCYVCHGIDALGSGTDIEVSFLATSTHILSPDESAYGPTEKQCSTCHDSHGTDRDADGDTYSALLRTTSTTNTDIEIFESDEFCAACHEERPASSYEGLAVWRQSAHSRGVTLPLSGTQIGCSNCHEQHGSNNKPLIRETLTPPAAPATATVDANDRRLCFGCHPHARATWVGSAAYEVSTHGTTEATVTIFGEWASSEATRVVGECQVCHAPMGRTDGSGGIFSKLTEAEGKALCFTCHKSDGIATDIARIEYPQSTATDKELVITYDPEELPSAYGRVAIFSAESTGTAPLSLSGPREYPPTGRSGDVSVGDIEADGVTDVVVGDPGANRIEVLSYDQLKGLRSTTYALGVGVTSDYVTVADIFIDGTGRPEIAVVTRSATSPYASNLYVYRYNGTGLTELVGPISVGNDASGLASGDVTAGAAADLAVTAMADDALRIFADSVSSPGTLITGGPYSTRGAPRGPSIGDAWDGGTTVNEVVVANSGEVTGTVSIISGAGTLLGSYNATGTGGAAAYDTLVADILPNVSGDEITVALRHDSATSSVNVFPQLTGGGLGARQNYDTGSRYKSSSLAAGDVDGDSKNELYVGNAGSWTRNAAAKKAPSVQSFRANGTGNALQSSASELLWGGGVEVAGAAPGLAIADLGGIGESRHPIGVVEDTHNSTEVATLTRHVECSDCHNTHEATSTPTVATGTAPAVIGSLVGAWGVEVENAPAAAITLSEKRGADYEYEVCMKCHSAWSDLEGGRDISSEIDTRNASFHAIEETSTAAENTDGSFVTTTPAWSADSQVYCSHCHGNADTDEPAGVHTSEEAPLLRSPYWGTTSDLAAMLCYDCHKYTVYYSGTEDGIAASTSYFYDDSATEAKLHRQHVFGGSTGFGYSCDTCHVSHGVDREHLLRSEVGFTHNGAGGGSCDNACHSTGSPTATEQAYDGS